MKKFWKFTCFCFVGFTVFVLDWIFFNFFYGIGLGFIISNTFSWIIAVVFNFTMNRNLTFSARGHSIKKQLFRWFVIYILAFLVRISYGGFILFLLGDGVFHANIALISGILVSIPISFLGSLFWVFKKDPQLI